MFISPHKGGSAREKFERRSRLSFKNRAALALALRAALIALDFCAHSSIKVKNIKFSRIYEIFLRFSSCMANSMWKCNVQTRVSVLLRKRQWNKPSRQHFLTCQSRRSLGKYSKRGSYVTCFHKTFRFVILWWNQKPGCSVIFC